MLLILKLFWYHTKQNEVIFGYRVYFSLHSFSFYPFIFPFSTGMTCRSHHQVYFWSTREKEKINQTCGRFQELLNLIKSLVLKDFHPSINILKNTRKFISCRSLSLALRRIKVSLKILRHEPNFKFPLFVVVTQLCPFILFPISVSFRLRNKLQSDKGNTDKS